MNVLKFAVCCVVLSASVASAQDKVFDLPAPPPLITIGGLYFNGPASSIKDGEFTNDEGADLRIKEIRSVDGRTYVTGTALQGHIVYLQGPARIKGDKTTLRVLTAEMVVCQFEQGENFTIEMMGEHEWFYWADTLPTKEKEPMVAKDGGNAPLFNPAPRTQVPSAAIPRRDDGWMVPIPAGPMVPLYDEPTIGPQGPVWFKGTIEPIPADENSEENMPAPIILDGPVAEESSPVRS